MISCPLIAALILSAELAASQVTVPSAETHHLRAPGQSRTLTIPAGGPAHSWPLTLGAGRLAGFEIAVKASHLRVRLFDPAGRRARALEASAGDPGPSSIVWVAETAGVWRIEVEAADRSQEAGYEIRWALSRAATQQDGQAWKAERLDQDVSDLLDAGEVVQAEAAAREAIALSLQRHLDDPPPTGRYVEDLALRFFYAPRDAARAWEISETLLKEALALWERAPGKDDPGLANALSTLSAVYYYQGRWDEAEPLEQRALEIRQRVLPENDPAVVESLARLGQILVRQGRYRESEPALSRALDAARKVQPSSSVQIIEGLNDLADLYRVQNRFNESEARFREALVEAERLGPEGEWLTARIVNNLAGLYKDTGRYDHAEPLLRRSVVLREKTAASNPLDLPTAYLNLAELHRLQGNATDAEPLYAKALEMARATLDAGNPELAWFLNQFAVFHAERESFTSAEALYREALSLLETSAGADHVMVAQTLHDLGGMLTAAARPAEAEPLYRRALAIRKASLGEDHPEVGITLTELARCATAGEASGTEAAALAEAAVAILGATSGYPEARADALARRAQIRRGAGDRAGAIEDLAAATQILEELRPHSGGGEATRADFLGRHLDHFDLLVHTLLESQQVARAFEYTERARGRALLDQLSWAGVDIRTRIPAQERAKLEARETAARSRLAEYQQRVTLMRARKDLDRAERGRLLADLEREVAQAAREFRTIYDEIKNASPLWRGSSGGEPVGLGVVQQELIPRRGLMLIYQIGDQGSHLMILPAGAARPRAWMLEISGRAAGRLSIPSGPLTSERLSEILEPSQKREGLIRWLSQPPPEVGFTSPGVAEAGADSARESLHALWSILVPKEAWSMIRGASEAILVPDGPLHRLPFEALVVEPGAPGETARYWLDEGPPLRYVASATLLREMSRRPRRSSGPAPFTLLSVSDPIYDLPRVPAGGAAGAASEPGPSAALDGAPGPVRLVRARDPLQRLPGTARETEEIVKRFSFEEARGRVRVLSQREATEPKVRAALKGNMFIHLATHGIVEEGRGDLFAALALTPPAGETASSDDDGFLQLFEVYDLDMECDLAVLSACSSQVGRQVEGEGVFALSRGFITAGARRVVASQWSVDDESTAALMGEFFSRIASAHKRGREPRYSEALRDAKRSVRRRAAWSEPWFWAPFVLTGVR